MTEHIESAKMISHQFDSLQTKCFQLQSIRPIDHAIMHRLQSIFVVYTSCSAGFLFAMTRTLLTSMSGTSRFRQRKCMWGQASKIYTRKSALLQIWHLMFLGRARVCSVHYSPYRLVMLTVLWYFWCVYLWRMNSSPCPELIPAWIAHTSRALPFVTSCSEPIETSIVHMQKAIIVPAYQRSFSSA